MPSETEIEKLYRKSAMILGGMLAFRGPIIVLMLARCQN